MITHNTGCLIKILERMYKRKNQTKANLVYDNYEKETHRFDLMWWRCCIACKYFVKDDFDSLKQHLKSYRHKKCLSGENLQ